MARERYEIQVGIVLVAGLLVLIFGMLWFQEYRFNSEHQEVQARFASAGGLGVGDPVHVRGIPMGKVSAVRLDDSGIIVSMSLETQVQLTQNAVFSVGSQGLVGERLINVEPGAGAPVADLATHVFDGQYELALAELAGRFDELNANLMTFLEKVDVVMDDMQESGGLGPLLEESTRAARVAADLLESNAEGIASATKSMAAVSEGLNEFLDEHGENLGEGVDNMSTAAAGLDSLLEQLSTVATGTQDILTAITEQRGTMGRLIYDEQMGVDVKESVDRLKFLIEDIQRNPQRYLTVKIF